MGEVSIHLTIPEQKDLYLAVDSDLNPIESPQADCDVSHRTWPAVQWIQIAFPSLGVIVIGYATQRVMPYDPHGYLIMLAIAVIICGFWGMYVCDRQSIDSPRVRYLLAMLSFFFVVATAVATHNWMVAN